MDSGYVQITERARSARNIAVDRFLKVPQGQPSLRTAQKLKDGANIKQALKLLLPRWRLRMRALSKTFSREQLLKSLVPASGAKGVKETMLQDAREVR